MLYTLYSFLFGAWVLLMAPFFAYKAWRHKKYLPALRQRMGFLPDTLKSDGRPVIWIHSCSVGETLSVVPLAAALRARFPQAQFAFSTITQTGQTIAQERFASYGVGRTFYFPIDLASLAGRVLDHVQPSVLVTIDTEIWPNVLHQCKRRGIPVVMANGRISAESFQYYRWAQAALGQIFNNYALLLMKSAEDAGRIRRMGAPASRVEISGNIKYDRGALEIAQTETKARELKASLGLSRSDGLLSDGLLIVAGSTHPGEEAVLLETLRQVRQAKGLEQTRLLLVPRHPERFAPVAELARASGFRIRRRTENVGGRDADVLVLDTLGELTAAYSFADVAFVGGTLIPHGGQSIMEPATFGRAIVVGPSMLNFPGIIDDFRDIGGVVQIPATDADKDAQVSQLTEAFVRLLSDTGERERMGQAARSVFQASQGATAFTVERIATVLAEKGIL